MSRLYDRILAHDHINKKERERLQSATVISVDNVAEYLYAGTDQEYWDLDKDYPNLAPPWQSFFMEYKRPSHISSEKHGVVSMENYPRTVGALFVVHPATIEHPDLYSRGIRWVISTEVYHEVRRHGRVSPYQPVWYMGWSVTYDGKVSDVSGPNFPGRHLESAPSLLLGQLGNFILSTLHPFYLAISFCHCKNVEVLTHAPSPKAQKMRKRQIKPPLTKYHVLAIEPMKQVLKSEGQSDKVGLKRSLHICRAHFKDYRDRGLFGRDSHKGIYWWDVHVRGNKSAGVVSKDYKINAPRSGAS